jgi:hypothetical protein
MLTLVTGANTGKYFDYLKQLLRNVIDIARKNNIIIRVVVYDLGLNEQEKEEIRYSFEDIILEKFDFSKYPEHVSLEKYNGKYCSYAWKPIIIYEVCEKYGGLVHWMDTRNLYTDFNFLIKILQINHIYTPITSGSVEKWTHPTCMNYMNGHKYKNLHPRAANIVGINYDIDWVKDLIGEWKDLSLVRECIYPDGSDRNNHRQDQAVLTILYYKYMEKYKFKDIQGYVEVRPHNNLLHQC